MHLQWTAFENIVGKEETARNEKFLLFPQCFLLNQIIVSPFVHIFDIISSFAAELEEPKIGISAKALNCLFSVIFVVIRKTTLTVLDWIGEAASMKSEIMRVFSLCTTEIPEIT